MKQTTTIRRLGVAEAKSNLSEVLREVAGGPTIIHNRGRDLAVVLAIEEYTELVGYRASAGGGAEFLERIARLERRSGGGVDGFEPERIALDLADPFARSRGA